MSERLDNRDKLIELLSKQNPSRIVKSIFENPLFRGHNRINRNEQDFDLPGVIRPPRYHLQSRCENI